MRKLTLALALIASLFAAPAYADFTGKDAAAATITFKNPVTCSASVCTPIFAQYDSSGSNAVAVLTAGADAASNTATGALGYMRNMVFNGTTWDRWQGAVTNAGTFAVQAAQSGTWNVTNISGTVSLPTGASTSALQTTANTSLATIATNTGAAIPAGSAIIGKVGIDQTTPGTTNAVSIQYGSTASVADPCQTAAKVYTPINIATATNVVIAGVSAKKKYICSIFLYPAGSTSVAVYQATTGTSCVTAQTDILGGHTTATGFVTTAQSGFVVGTGMSSVAGTGTVNTDICVTQSAAVQLSGVVVTVDQ